uniref:C-type lectin domain-containing protein n=1 Tax=Oryzias latipes TaxID=8090 RepID=A0A3P9MCQ7_ORYLA
MANLKPKAGWAGSSKFVWHSTGPYGKETHLPLTDYLFGMSGLGTSWGCPLVLGTEKRPQYVFVNEIMNWSSAQRHCKQNFTDLATVRDDTDWQTIYNVVPFYQNLWMGLYRDSNISWSDGSNFSFYQTPLNLLLQPGVVKLQPRLRQELQPRCSQKTPFTPLL